MPTPRSRPFPPRRPYLIGVVHLPALPGAPQWKCVARPTGRGQLSWIERAVSDARVYSEAGFDAVIVENYGDAPFFKQGVPPETVAAMGMAAYAVRDALPESIDVGVNVLRNDARAALAVAAAARLTSIRVNVLAGAAVTDQGIVEGDAARLLRDRARLAPDVRILADLRVKHAAPLAPRPLEEEALDLVERAGADAVVVTGSRTGAAVDPETLGRLRQALSDAPLLVGSGATRHTVRGLLADADGVIVGTAVKRGRRTSAAVDPRMAAAFVEAARD